MRVCGYGVCFSVPTLHLSSQFVFGMLKEPNQCGRLVLIVIHWQREQNRTHTQTNSHNTHTHTHMIIHSRTQLADRENANAYSACKHRHTRQNRRNKMMILWWLCCVASCVVFAWGSRSCCFWVLHMYSMYVWYVFILRSHVQCACGKDKERPRERERLYLYSICIIVVLLLTIHE